MCEDRDKERVSRAVRDDLVVYDYTAQPNSAWVSEQKEAFLDQNSSRDEKTTILMHDRDTKFTQEFVDKLNQKGVQHNALPKASPNLNGRCERGSSMNA
jgi:hypothetical protein